MFSRLSSLARVSGLKLNPTVVAVNKRCQMGHKVKGHLLPEHPYKVSFGLLRIGVVVTAGLLIGAVISKSIANFLEENDLFVPSDDDDDDD